MAKNSTKNNDVQNTTQKTKDRATRIPLNTEVNSGAPSG
jgi:hypothetical protein